MGEVTLPQPAAIVIDIEGTTSSTWFVHRTLYPFSRERFADYLRRETPVIAEVRTQIETEAGIGPDAPIEEHVRVLNAWLDRDDKRTPLKTLQGLIWRDGFDSGELTSHFFADALPTLRRWRGQGIRLAVFSSGSVDAQQAWFGHTPEGSVLPLFEAHFDTRNAGPKKVRRSYEVIRQALGLPARRILFLSDLVEELDAAATDGWLTCGVRRRGDQYWERGVAGHPEVYRLDELCWEVEH